MKITLEQLYRISQRFHKLAAFEFDPESSWIPDEFKSLPVFKNFPTSKVEKIFASFGLKDFVVEIPNEEFSLQEHKQDIVAQIIQFLISAVEDLHIERNYVLEQSTETIDQNRLNEIDACIRFAEILRREIFNSSSLRTTRDLSSYPADTNVIQIYQDLRQRILKIDPNILMPNISFDILKEFQKKSPVYLVFSTKTNDLAGIAERGIQSCQSLTKGNCSKIDQYNKRLAGTILSKYIGVCYLTRQNDFKGRGWKMITRALVRQVVDPEHDWKPAILLDKLYPVVSSQIVRLMKQELQKHSSVPVVSAEEINLGGAKSPYSPEFQETEILPENRSYHDTNLKNYQNVLDDAQSPDPYDRLRAAQNMNPADLYLLMNDEDPAVRIMVARRIPLPNLIKMVQDPSPDVGLELTKRLPLESLHLLVWPGQDEYVLEVLSKKLPKNQLYRLENLLSDIRDRGIKDSIQREIENRLAANH